MLLALFFGTNLRQSRAFRMQFIVSAYPQQGLCPCILWGGLKAAPSIPVLFQIFSSSAEIITVRFISKIFLQSRQSIITMITTSYFVKLYDVPVGIVTPPPSFEAVYCFICDHWRVAVDIWWLVLFVIKSSHQIELHCCKSQHIATYRAFFLTIQNLWCVDCSIIVDANHKSGCVYMYIDLGEILTITV